MINMDSEDLGIITAGCAGGLRSTLTKKCEVVPFAGECLTVTLNGLFGGHSGVDICSGRANANKLMGRLLAKWQKTEGEAHLVSLCGGSKDNAIPSICQAVIATADAEKTTALLQATANEISAELAGDDKGFFVTVTPTEAPATMFAALDSAQLIAILAAVDNGVKEMNYNIKGLPEWSRNLGVITTTENEVEFVFASRSAIESRLDASIDELDALGLITGCVTKHYSRYPGWDYAPVSPLRDLYAHAYREITGKDAIVDVIHAGLECGIIVSKLPDLDVISVGPDMRDVHSPDERLNLSSVEVFWQTIEKLVEML